MNGNMNLGKRVSVLEKDGGADIKKEISDLQVAVAEAQNAITTVQGEISNLENKVNSGHVYSTDEKVVGKWIDGKTLYEKTYIGTGSSTDSTDYFFDNDIVNLDIIVECNITAKITETASAASEIPNMQLLGGNLSISYVKTTNKFSIRQLQTSGSSTFVFNMTVRYTKTN